MIPELFSQFFNKNCLAGNTSDKKRSYGVFFLLNDDLTEILGQWKEEEMDGYQQLFKHHGKRLQNLRSTVGSSG